MDAVMKNITEEEYYEELMEQELKIQEEREVHEESLWAHDPDTGERTFYFGCAL